MIARVQADNKLHAAKIQFSAFKLGLTTERDEELVLITYNDPQKVLSVIKESGGKVIKVEENV